MTIKANGRAVPIIAAGIWVCVSGPLLAAQDGETVSEQAAKVEVSATAEKPVAFRKYARHSSRYWKRHATAQRKFRISARKSSHAQELAATGIATTGDEAAASALPAHIADANAEMLPTDGMPDAADTRLVSADQLNDVDRALTESSVPAPLIAMAAANAPVKVGPPVTVSSEDSAWSKSSIIGKIFIAFGGLLTLASAARMFMA